MDILRTPRARPEAEPPVPLLAEDRSKFKSVFEWMVLAALDSITVQDEKFRLSAVMHVMEAEEDGPFSNEYGATVMTEAGDWHLISGFFILLQADKVQMKNYQLCFCGLGYLAAKYKEMLDQFGRETNSGDDIVLASELGRLIYSQIIKGAKELKSDSAEVALDLLLQHETVLANYARFDAFLNVFDSSRR